MKVWIANHGPDRKLLHVIVRTSDDSAHHPAFIRGEWNANRDTEDGFVIPRMPAVGDWSNTDPLVIGKHMYFDYCLKGRRRPRPVNFEARNMLRKGDLVVFGGYLADAFHIDTVFAIGESKTWPEEGIPSWPDLDEVPLRVHFHSHAHNVQHREVHEPGTVPACSYRGETFNVRAWE